MKHGLSNTRLYRIYRGMLQRCQSNLKIYRKIYLQKGIQVCVEWQSENGFLNFYNWAISNGYEDNLTIDRKNPDKGYCPSNCQWLTRSENSKKAWRDTGRNVYLKRYPGAILYQERLK